MCSHLSAYQLLLNPSCPMKLDDFVQALSTVDSLVFVLPNGVHVPPYFHITEVGALTRSYIDCGGTIREEVSINLQVYTSTDYDHRLIPGKLARIVQTSRELLALPNAEMEVEYQGQTIEKYGLEFSQGQFQLMPRKTDCLAKDVCGIPVDAKPEVLASVPAASYCTPGSGCC
jgi:hypothetical protein